MAEATAARGARQGVLQGAGLAGPGDVGGAALWTLSDGLAPPLARCPLGCPAPAPASGVASRTACHAGQSLFWSWTGARDLAAGGLCLALPWSSCCCRTRVLGCSLRRPWRTSPPPPPPLPLTVTRELSPGLNKQRRGCVVGHRDEGERGFAGKWFAFFSECVSSLTTVPSSSRPGRTTGAAHECRRIVHGATNSWWPGAADNPLVNVSEVGEGAALRRCGAVAEGAVEAGRPRYFGLSGFKACRQ